MAAVAEKRKQKRSAAALSEPKAKKARFEETKSVPAATDKGKKRSRPVTLPLKEESEASSDEGSEQEQEHDEVDEEMDVDAEGPSKPAKDPNGAFVRDCQCVRGLTYIVAARESHKAQKALHEQRRAAKPHSELLVEAKKAWSLARQKNITKEERTKHIHALVEVVRGKVKDIVFKHDASRIIQTIVKYGGQKERNEIAEELKGRYKDLAQNKYSKVC